MTYSLKRIVDPSDQPIELPDAKKHCVIAPSNTDQDALILSYILAAVEYCESYTQRQLLPATWRMSFDGGAPDVRIRLKRPPLISVTEVSYRDGNGDSVVIDPSSYRVLTDCEPGILVPTLLTCWPLTSGEWSDFTVIYQAGYPNAAAVPEMIKHAIRLLVKHWFENREAVLVGSISKEQEFAVRALLDRHVLEEWD